MELDALTQNAGHSFLVFTEDTRQNKGMSPDLLM